MKLLLSGNCANCDEEWGPPPDSILSIPPPPLPKFIQMDEQNQSAATSSCVWAPTSGATGVEFVELPRKGSAANDTWLFLVGASFLGVLMLGALLAVLLLKCRSRIMSKTPMPHSAVSVKKKGCESVLYPYPVASQDGRVLWATITARGTTQHFTAAVPMKPTLPPPDPPITFDNTGFVDSDSQTPLMESYQLNELVDSDSTSSGGTLRPRPRVSTPTRIEHPNMPPLNTLPHRTLRRAAVQRRDSDLSTCPSPL